MKKSQDPFEQENPLRNERVSELTEQILASYKNCSDRRPSAERNQFIDGLADETKQCLSDLQELVHRAKRTLDAYEEATGMLIGHIYELMRSYSFEFNSTVLWNEVHITCTKPSLVTEVLRYSTYREPVETVTNIRTRLSTRYFSLVIIGRRNKVEFLLLPVQKVIGLTKAEAEYSPLLTLTATFDGQNVSWHNDGDVLSQELLERICRDLFRTLVETSRSQSQGQYS